MEERLEYKFKNINLLKNALTHTSLLNQKEKKEINHFQRLEFLGDSVLSLTISEYLYCKFSFSSEGELSKMKSIIISQQFLINFTTQIGLENYISLGKGVDLQKGRGKYSILTDCFEACLGAIYLDGGINHCKKIINNFMEKKKIETMIKNQINDYKTYLQELTQKRFQCLPLYKIIKEKGLEHQKIFYAEVSIRNLVYGSGPGKNKKEAEQNAAYHALKKLKVF